MRRAALTITIVALVGAPVSAQPREATSQPSSASYLNSSFEATEALERAGKLADAKQWSGAAAALQATAEKYGDFLVPIDVRRHVSVREFVNQRISKWPSEGLEAYRIAFEIPARAALNAAMEAGEEALLRVADRYYATSSAAAALDEAGERAMERGAFKSARRWYLRLAADHPDRERSAGAGGRATNGELWRAKAALCAAWSGDPAPLRSLIGSLEDQHVEGTVPWGGQERRLVDFLKESLAAQFARPESRLTSAPEELVRSAAPGGAMLGVTPDRRGFARSEALAEARLWRFNAFGRALWEEELSGYESQSARKDAWMRMLQSGRMLACVAVAGPPSGRTGDSRWVFLHDAQSVWAVDPSRPEQAVWRFDMAGGAVSAKPSWTAEDEPPPQFTSLLWGGRLYVHLDTEQPATSTGQTLVSSVLMCFDATSGAVLWQNKLDGFASSFEDTRIDGAPILHEGKLFAVARRRKPFGFEACYLLRFDAESGKLVWSVHLGESATGTYGYHRATLTHASADGDLVFVQTNLGTTAAVSSDTGRVVWLSQYESKYADSPEGFWPSRMGRPTRAWQYPEAVVWRDAVVVMPLDADVLIGLSQLDGRELFKVSLESLGNPEQLIGAVNDVIYVVGSNLVCYDLSVRSPVWQRPLETGQIFGRAALTTNGVFIPTDRALLRYPLEGGPASAFQWSLEDAGNLTATSDQILVTAATSLYGLAAKEAAFEQLTRRMTESPDDPAAALALAELAFSTREDARGLAAVEEAIQRLGGFARIADEPARRRLFVSLTQFAGTVLDSREEFRREEGGIVGRAPTAIALLRWAGQCAPDAQGQVAYRLQLARAQLLQREVTAAAATYQQILSDRSLRTARMRVNGEVTPPGYRASTDTTDDDSEVEIGGVIGQWMSWLIANHGSDIYAAIEAAAQDRLTVARASQDAAGLLEIADAFPNSRAARSALADHAAVMTDRGELQQAARSYRRALNDSEIKDRPRLVRAFADCLIRTEKWSEAAQWLERGQREFASYRFDYNGRPVGFAEYRKAMIGSKALRDTACPEGSWPVEESFKRLYPERITVLDPLFPHLPRTAWDALVTYCGSQIEARHPTTCNALWSRPMASATQPQLLGMDADRFIFATGHRLFALTRTSGQLSWSVGEEPDEDPGEDPESHEAWTCHFLGNSRLISSSDRGELVCVDTASGTVVWRRQGEAHTNNQIVANDAFVCYATWQGRQHAIAVLDARTGKPLTTARPEEDWPVQGLAITPEGLLLVLFSNAIHALEPTNGKARWRVTTVDRFVPATLHVDEEGVFISPDGRRIAKYDPLTGRQLWTTPPVTNGAADGLWSQASDGVIFAACGEQLAAFDEADGRALWNVRSGPGTRAESPRLTSDSVVMVYVQKAEAAADKKDSAKGDAPKAYRIVRFRRSDGQRGEIWQGDELVTPPLASFGGVYLRDRGVIILDGNRLFGYSAAKDVSNRRP